VNDTPCSGNRCITIEQPIGGSCGNTPGGETDGSGVRTGASTIEVSALWPLWPSDGQQRTIAHELGHLLGLEDYDSSHCGVSDAAMQDTFDCSSSPVMKDVTVNDQLPVNSTSYGGGTRTICGF
jgi:hypothetical protein